MPSESRTHHTFCRICEALCGLEVTTEDGRITRIRPDDDHVATRGFGCAKGLKQHKMYDSPDRLRYPLKRVGDDWERVSWDQALAEIGEKVRQLRGDFSPDSIAMYVGTAAGFSFLHPLFAQGFMTGLGSKSVYASATQDCANKFAVARQMYGFPFTQPFPDLDRTQCLIVAGANPVVSKWSFLQVPNPGQQLREIEARGAKVYFVDPRKTESAKVAGEHVFIRPNTDVFFFLSFLNELIATGGVDRERVEQYMSGFDLLERLVEPWPAERTAPVTRIDAGKVREMVRDYREADGAALYCSTGVNMGTNGSLAFWLQEAVNAVSGNLDRFGGTLVGRGIIDFAKLGAKGGVGLRDDVSRVGGYASVNDAFPGGILPDEILTPGPRQVKALFVTGGNPLITMANSARLRDALEQLELLVVTDIYLNESASLAHYVLPATSPFERPDIPFIFPLLLGLQSKPYLQATEPVVRADGEQRDEATIYTDLADACGISLFGSKLLQGGLRVGKRVASRKRPDEQPSIPQRGLMSAVLKLTRNPGFNALLEAPHGTLRDSHEAGGFLGTRLVTDDGRVHLAPSVLVEQAQKLEADFQAELDGGARLKLITKRAVTTHNSWTHNIEEFVEGDRSTNFLYMHPDDARAAGLAAGHVADVISATGSVRVPVQINKDLMPGTVALPHGWGHQAARGLSVASKTTGVNVNLLAADGPDALEKVSGMAHLTGIPVDVVPARGERCTTDWSGIAPAPGEKPESDVA